MAAIDLLDGAPIPPMRDEDCAACQLLAHGHHCQRINRHGQPCQCGCRSRTDTFNCLTPAMPVSVPGASAPQAPRAGTGIGGAGPTLSAGARPALHPSTENRPLPVTTGEGSNAAG